MHPNARLIQQFYSSFQNLDAAGMARCYHPQVQFRDPVFPDLQGAEAGAMWSMLTTTVKKANSGWTLTVENIQADDHHGSCTWHAHYTFSQTGRKVHNIIQASFEFADGTILRHTDTFDFYRWARQAFGFTGVLIGWTPFFQKKVQATVAARLNNFIAKQ